MNEWVQRLMQIIKEIYPNQYSAITINHYSYENGQSETDFWVYMNKESRRFTSPKELDNFLRRLFHLHRIKKQAGKIETMFKQMSDRHELKKDLTIDEVLEGWNIL